MSIELLEELRTELMTLRSDITLLNYDITEIRKQLDRIEMVAVSSQPRESIGIDPNTPPPTFRPIDPYEI